jgi:hypothetical protein
MTRGGSNPEARNMKRGLFLLPLVLLLHLGILVGCGGSPNHGPSLASIPIYPGSIGKESMAGSSPMGLMGVRLNQYTTRDTYDEVVAFYKKELGPLSPQVQSFATQFGRQISITLPQDDGVINVGIQEITEERRVYITISGAGT